MKKTSILIIIFLFIQLLPVNAILDTDETILEIFEEENITPNYLNGNTDEFSVDIYSVVVGS